ncbi:uncharacterized protein LOC116433988 isoform X3 [Nomia melanderi]|uniref:uncharacterized protein LOC116433988 isoform X3 n=1 Tax=Nomia melanderi TaxID=2448451 RepID=UPI003FCC6933
MILTNQLGNYSELNDSEVPILRTFSYSDHGDFYSTSTQRPINKRTEDVYPFTATQLIILLLFIFGIFFALIMYCKTCSRSYQERFLEERECRGEENEANSLHNSYYTIQESRDRPPSYSEACGAPPLYGSPFNRASVYARATAGLPRHPQATGQGARSRSSGELSHVTDRKEPRAICTNVSKNDPLLDSLSWRINRNDYSVLVALSLFVRWRRKRYRFVSLFGG